MTNSVNNNAPWEPLVYNPKPPTLFNRTVTWYNNVSKSNNPHARRAAAVLMIAMAALMSLTVLAIPLVIKFTAKLSHLREVEQFYAVDRSNQKPDISGHVEIETKTQTFNHVASYVIHNRIIWYKLRKDASGNEIKNGEWKPIYFDGWPDQEPVEIKVDGANLIVIDDQKCVHYKKVIKERLENVEQFFKLNKNARKPPVAGDFGKNTSTQCSDNDNSVIIFDNKVWIKQKSVDNAEWQLVYVPLKYDYYGKPGLKPKELELEDGNLLVTDNKGGKHRIAKDMFFRDQNFYTLHDKSEKDNWKDRWFTLPFFNLIVNVFTGKKLYLPDGTKAWGIGHRGQFNQYIEDRDGNKHRVSTGVTTLYILDESGQNIYLYDPWKPKSVKVKIPVVGSQDTPFVAETLTVAASQIMLIGYRYEKKGEGEVEKIPEIRTMIVDVDSLGWNPTITYAYSEKDRAGDPDVRLLPTAKDGWKIHSLPDGEYSSNITILQTGEGNSNRELRVVGKQGNKNGYWYKPLSDESWKFKEFDLQADFVAMESSAVDQLPQSIFHHWKLEGDINAELKDFNNECISREITIDGAKLLLHRKENIIVKILTGGKEFHHYDLVLPEGAEMPESLKKYFKDKKVVPVTVKVDKKDQTLLRIKGRGLSKLHLQLRHS